jgi:DNA invertase Pin-like site-specific DNA recombinase
MTATRRCAVYTRKSTDEGLEQDFNSLDAQREACEAYIKSQRHEGWRLLPEQYDDGGYSGGTMARPALARLMEAVKAGRVDIIVVYKVDRLTRSLSDFAKMVEVFDASGVSFVSVTQQFNTTTSMGRLTLNVLLSFAQFEREVTAERIRDKIAASKRKGMWMGGVVPLGYDVVDRKLIVNEAEAETVRTVFQLYLKLANTRLVKREADRLGLRTKARRPNNGQREGGIPFTRGHINKLLKNRIYVGEIVHREVSYPGEHEAIVDQGTWQAVQEQLGRNAVVHRGSTNATDPSLLAGLIFDQDRRRMLPSHANKAGRRYRYYVSKRPDDAPDDDPVLRIPARAIEEAVLQRVANFLRDKPRLVDVFGSVQTQLPRMMSAAAVLADRLLASGPVERRGILLDLLRMIEVHRDRVRVVIRISALGKTLGGDLESDGSLADDDLQLDFAMQLKRAGMAMKLVVNGDRDSPRDPDPNLVAAVVQGWSLFAKLRRGEARSVRHLAELHDVDRGDASRLVALAFLAPDIVEAILDGRQPAGLTAARLLRIPDLPVSWAAQRRILGFV